jgi:hypothetical protein
MIDAKNDFNSWLHWTWSMKEPLQHTHKIERPFAYPSACGKRLTHSPTHGKIGGMWQAKCTIMASLLTFFS